jgi:hypothetical protein
MNGWTITDPMLFFGIAGAVVAYIVYMMIRGYKARRTEVAGREREL